jgi:hypothetical protein
MPNAEAGETFSHVPMSAIPLIFHKHGAAVNWQGTSSRVQSQENRKNIQVSQMKLSGDSIVVATNSQVSTVLGSETVILNFNQGAYFGLNEVGTLIWAELQQPRRVSDLCDAVLAEYDVEPEQCRQDIFRLLEKLHAEGLIEVRGGPAA